MVRAAAPPAVSVSVAVFPLLRSISGNRAPQFAHIAAARHRRRPTLRPGGAGVYRLVPVAGAANRLISEFCRGTPAVAARSEVPTSELMSLIRISYAVSCLQTHINQQ